MAKSKDKIILLQARSHEHIWILSGKEQQSVKVVNIFRTSLALTVADISKFNFQGVNSFFEIHIGEIMWYIFLVSEYNDKLQNFFFILLFSIL